MRRGTAPPRGRRGRGADRRSQRKRWTGTAGVRCAPADQLLGYWRAAGHRLGGPGRVVGDEVSGLDAGLRCRRHDPDRRVYARETAVPPTAASKDPGMLSRCERRVNPALADAIYMEVVVERNRRGRT